MYGGHYWYYLWLLPVAALSCLIKWILDDDRKGGPGPNEKGC